MPGPRVAFKRMTRNPNPNEACACSPNSKVADCCGPFLVLTHSESMNVRAPHIVIGTHCMRQGMEKLHPGAFKVETVTVEVEGPKPDVDGIIATLRGLLETPDAPQAA